MSNSTLTAIINRRVDNPLLDSAERMEQWEREVKKAERQGRKPDYDVLRVNAESNEMTRMGALCFIPGRTEEQERAAVRFKNEYEALYGSVSPAVDPSREPVDTSPIAHDAGMAARIDRSDSIVLVIFGDAKRDLPPVLDSDEVDLLLSCVCMGEPSSRMVDKMPGGKPNHRQAQARNRQILHALDRLSKHWGYTTEKAA